MFIDNSLNGNTIKVDDKTYTVSTSEKSPVLKASHHTDVTVHQAQSPDSNKILFKKHTNHLVPQFDNRDTPEETSSSSSNTIASIQSKSSLKNKRANKQK